MPLNIDHLRSWVGRSEMLADTVTPVPVAALSATLDRDDPHPRPGDPLPPLWHWLYFLPLPRRMWAGSRFAFHRPLRVGEAVRRTSTIADVTHKEGRSGTGARLSTGRGAATRE